MFSISNIKKLVYGIFCFFIVIYLLSVFLSPIDPETLSKYNVSEFQMRVIMVTILLPLVAIWASAAYGFVHFKQYALSIKGSLRGKGTNTIANGLGLIALQLFSNGMFSVITSIDSVKTALGGDQGVTVISTGLEVGFAIVIIIVLYQGAGQLLDTLSKHTKPTFFTKSFYFLATVSGLYLFSVVTEHSKNTDVNSISFHAPLSVILLFVALPHIVTWNISLLTVKRLYHYRNHATGKVYKRTLGLLTTGLLLIVFSSALIQLLNAFGDAFANLNLPSILVIVYLLIFAIGIGYLYLARAATKLRNIES